MRRWHFEVDFDVQMALLRRSGLQARSAPPEHATGILSPVAADGRFWRTGVAFSGGFLCADGIFK